MNLPPQNRIVAFGDSTTARRDGIIVYAERLQSALDESGIPPLVINAGVAGNTTAMARERFEADVYDSANRLRSTQSPLGDLTTLVYDTAGQWIATIDALGQVFAS